jgi:hypothetical protein
MLIPPGVDILNLINGQLDLVINTVFKQFGGTTIRGSSIENNSGIVREEYTNDYVEAGRATIDDLNLFSIAQGLRNDVFDTGNAGNFGRTLTIEFGNLIMFKELVITNCDIIWGGEQSSQQSMIPLNEAGFPMSATVLLDVRASKIFTRNQDKTRDSYSKVELEAYNTQKLAEIQVRPDKSPPNYVKHMTDKVKSSDIYKKFLKLGGG